MCVLRTMNIQSEPNYKEKIKQVPQCFYYLLALKPQIKMHERRDNWFFGKFCGVFLFLYLQ